MTDPTTPSLRVPRVARSAAWIAMLAYAAAALSAMWSAPRVPYADAWRFIAHFLRTPFPRNILAPDNGHHEVLPNAVRVLELHALSAQQWLQVVVGIGLMLATLGVIWRSVGTLADARMRAAAMLAATLGLCWLGNVRALAHANESVHAYLVTLSLVIGLGALSRRDASTQDIGGAAVAAACGLIAAFSFGSGIACFAAFAIVLALRRAGWRPWAVLVSALLLTLALLHASRGAGADAALRLAPLAQAEHLVRWLSGPFVYVTWPAVDPALAAQVPLSVARVPLQAIAQGYEAAFGPVMLAHWPHALVGIGGLVWLACASWRTWRQPASAALMGLGIAWFAVAVGAMIALVRLGYLQTYPEQLLAPRYVVWSSLFWAGLGIAGVANVRRPARALACVLTMAIVLLPSQVWMAKLGAGMVRVAEQSALAAAIGVVEPDLPLGETVPADLAAALPPLREARAAMFAWPQTSWLGRAPPRDALAWLAVDALQVADVDNRFGAPGRRVRFTLDDAPGDRLLLVDDDGVVRGLALRDRDARQWIGWMQRGSAGHAPPRVAALSR